MISVDNRVLISVIVPNFNHAKYLDQRLTSILNQTYTNIEVIILDDHSNDNSLEVIEPYLKDERIVSLVVNDKNTANTFQQWKRGLSMAKGEVVWIAESDDFCQPKMLEELVKAYQHCAGTVLAYTTPTLVDENGIQMSWYKTFRNKYMSGKQYLKHYLTLGNYVRNASCAIFNKEAALSIKDDYVDFAGAGDYLFWARLVTKGRVAIVNKNMSYFRRHSGVVTDKRDADGSNFLAEEKILSIISEYVRISQFRRKLIFAHHCKRIEWTSFNNDEIRKQVESIWEYDTHTDFISRCIWRFANSMRTRYNVFI